MQSFPRTQRANVTAVQRLTFPGSRQTHLIKADSIRENVYLLVAQARMFTSTPCIRFEQLYEYMTHYTIFNF